MGTRLNDFMRGRQYPLDILINGCQYTVIHYNVNTMEYTIEEKTGSRLTIQPTSNFEEIKLMETKCLEENVTKFDSGAVRSTDANATAYFAISPIALEYVQSTYRSVEKSSTAEGSLLYVLENLNLFLKDSELDYLVYAACHALNAAEYAYNPEPKIHNDILPYYGLRSLAMRHAEGNTKYGYLNWELGMPVHDLLNHAIKHCYDYLHEKTEDPNEIGGIIWGCFAAIHSYVLWPELNKPFLRGPNCQLTDSVLERLKKQ